MTQLPTEAETRQNLIDQQLASAGWSIRQRNILTEFLLANQSTQLRESSGKYQAGDQFADYVLLDRNKQPLAIVEAKRSSRDALAGQRQSGDYADQMVRLFGTEPFIFLSNGRETWFWDRRRYPLRQISGFFTPDDLERLAFQREYQQPLAPLGPDAKIAGRPYQVEAIKRVTESLERGQRKFLLVMATGTGKTRTVVALVELLLRAKWIQRVLFLADRRELVRQALGDFKQYLPNETRARIEGGDLDQDARIHIATYPSMMQVYRKLSPGYYDLIIADESHRSIYNRYLALFNHFDALQLGLTATPTDYIDHNTFELFECPDGRPTFYYPYKDAVRDNYLVNYRVLEAQTSFQIEGIKAGELPIEVHRQLIEQGIDISDFNFEGSDLEHRITNSGTNDAIVEEFMRVCRKDASGTLPAKTIFFAMSHDHAVELWKSFNRRYPQHQRRGLAQVIDSHMERADLLLDDWKRNDMPRIAISVDMLDTGIDVPAVQNLVFAKPVFSQVKFWQMIGRGTRLWIDQQTGQPKKDFLIIDHWNNFAYFNMNPEGEVGSSTEPLPVRLFRLRLEKLLLLRGQTNDDGVVATILQLQSMLRLVPHDNINIRPHLVELHGLMEPAAWEDLSPERVEHLSQTIAPLLRFIPDVNFIVLTFEARTEQLAIAYLMGDGKQVAKLRDEIVADLQRLPTSLREIQTHADKLAKMRSHRFWEHLTYQHVMDLQTTFAPLMRFRQRQSREMIRLNLPDQVVSRRWVIYGPSGEGAFADNYREQVEAQIKTLADQHPTLRKLKQGEPLDEKDQEALAESLNRPDLFIREEVLRDVYEQTDGHLVDFVKQILNPSEAPNREEQISATFDAFIAAHPHFTATQLNFLRTIRAAVIVSPGIRTHKEHGLR